MAFKRKIITRVECPRCKAQAELRTDDADRKMFAVYLKCPKCRYSKLVGISSWEIYRNNILVSKLSLLAGKTDDTMLKASLEAKIEKLKEINNKKELGL